MRVLFLRGLLFFCLVGAPVPTVAFAQGSFFTTLTGTVVDSSGGVIPGADVKVKNNETGAEFNTVTATDGGFSIPSLPGGTYTVTVSLGFKTSVLNSVTLNAAVPASVKVTLAVGTPADESIRDSLWRAFSAAERVKCNRAWTLPEP